MKPWDRKLCWGLECDSSLTCEGHRSLSYCQEVLWGQEVGGLALHPRFQVVCSSLPLPQGPDVPVRAGLQGRLGGHHVRRAGCSGRGPAGTAEVGRIHLWVPVTQQGQIPGIIGTDTGQKEGTAGWQSAIEEASPFTTEAGTGSLRAKSGNVLLACIMVKFFLNYGEHSTIGEFHMKIQIWAGLGQVHRSGNMGLTFSQGKSQLEQSSSCPL